MFEFIDNLPIVAHNAQFDFGFLRNEYYRNFSDNFPKHKDLCTMQLWKFLYSSFQHDMPESSTLSTLVHCLLDDDDIKYYTQNKHDAFCDAMVTAKIFMKIYDDNYLNVINN